MQKVSISTLYTYSSCISKTDSEKKIKILLKIFFSSLSQTNLSNIEDNEYKQNRTTKNVMIYEMIDAIKTTIFKKTFEKNEIINDILNQICDIITSILCRIYNSCLTSRYCSKHFRNAVTIILRKSNKKNYTMTTLYISIALLNTISKMIKFIIARKLSYLTKMYNLLSRTQMKTRKTVSTKHIIHYMLKRIYAI